MKLWNKISVLKSQPKRKKKNRKSENLEVKDGGILIPDWVGTPEL